MATVNSGSSVTFGIQGDQTLTVTTSPGAEGTIVLNGSPGAIGANYGPMPLSSKVFGPYGQNGAVTINAKNGAVTYTLSTSALPTVPSSSTGVALAVPYVQAQSAVPVILLSSATAITATGAITGLTALPYQPSGVVQVYCFAQTGLTAGLYYATFSSTTACQLYTNAAGTVTPTGITPGAYTGGTTAATLATISVPGGAMGANGALRLTAAHSVPANTNVKTPAWAFAGTTVGTIAVTGATVYGGAMAPFVRNRNSQSVQVVVPVGGNNTSLAASSVLAIDTSAAQSATFTGTLAVATDFLILEGYTVEVLPGA